MAPNGQAPVLSHSHPSRTKGRQAVGAITKRTPQKKPSSSKKRSRTTEVTPHTGPDVSSHFVTEEEEEELTLRSDAPADDRYLFQLRNKYLSEKGKGMWEEMKAEYSKKHLGNWEKAALQMKVSRAVAKYGEWPDREKKRLMEAFQYFEEKRYQLIIARMKENGGCRAWAWKPQHIETQLVKMGLEEEKLNESTGTRRRRKLVAT
ncbi:hypothetical protein N0V88_000715 [Collariella sp. IMI 366227]|nr:hypothetical protein N0V88_000715 [Collariella sp. IMI 366227]